ncbi:hypothetical protein A8L34_27925 [Bacillus sp. FJAT-27264]|uniref:hypothetical protein n=1 Tax=Paenibacillus sp. (strain DSM 101736 / FJAT-27264) TaxID=1850362 RepID=UPI000807F8D4|nr:hypothetical protein [Bacillus sp. FJAT-27264]OBZ15877.1 hypothetical protein A8L34_27925 [Bacillus sp. FJAT-27264]
MKIAIYAFFVFLVTGLLWTAQSDNHITMTGKNRLKYSLDLATHDAAQMVNKEQLSDGFIIFDDVEAKRVLEERLKMSLKLNENFNPKEDGLFRSTDQMRLLLFETVDSGMFPRVYKADVVDAAGQSFQYIDYLYGPSVVAVISIPTPRPYGISKKYTYFVGSSHEYKANK